MQTNTTIIEEESFRDLFEGGMQVVEASEAIPAGKKFPHGAEVVIYGGYAYLRAGSQETPIGPAEKDDLDRIVSQVLR